MPKEELNPSSIKGRCQRLDDRFDDTIGNLTDLTNGEQSDKEMCLQEIENSRQRVQNAINDLRAWMDSETRDTRGYMESLDLRRRKQRDTARDAQEYLDKTDDLLSKGENSIDTQLHRTMDEVYGD
jgi:hypothetical protein